VTIHEHVVRARVRLESAGLAARDAALDAEVLARHALGWDIAAFLARRHERPPHLFDARYEDLLARREGREPVALIVGVKEFWGLEFEVTPAVLVPRPETELIVEEAIAAHRGGPSPRRIVDAGTGSGCLAVALAREFPQARVVATDTSAAALAVARRNAERHGARIEFREGEFLQDVDAGVDLIVSNPPYVQGRDFESLPPEVARYEPRAALVADEGGMGAIRLVLEAAERILTPMGWLILEFGEGQETALRRLASRRERLSLERIRRDLQGIPRTAVFQRG
jgi:release factor glutamine methyltransferase